MEGVDPLDLDIRRRIYRFIIKNPGLHEREISRILKIPLTTVDYHLHYLVKRDILQIKIDGHYARFYAKQDIGIKEMSLLSILRTQVTRRILIFLMTHPYASHREIAHHMMLSSSTVSFHLKKMINTGVISQIKQSRGSFYLVNEPDVVINLLITYRRSFFDHVVDHFVDIWYSLHPEIVNKKKNKINGEE
ncbi:MAG: winged helix-turn-helix transcriptional regulator [Candidatus Thermoplasmatota archaeon]